MPAVAAPRKGRAGRPSAPLPGAGRGSWRQRQQQERPPCEPPAKKSPGPTTRSPDCALSGLKDIRRRNRPALGISKNAVVGRAHRLGLSGRQSPIKPTGLGRPSHPRGSPVPKLADITPLKTCARARKRTSATDVGVSRTHQTAPAGAKTAPAGRVQALLLAPGRPRHGGVPVLRPDGADRETILRSTLPHRVHAATGDRSPRLHVRPTMTRRIRSPAAGRGTRVAAP